MEKLIDSRPYFALIVLAIEPLMNMIGGIYFSNTSNISILKYMLIAYLIFIIFTYFLQIYGKQTIFCGTSSCTPGNNSLLDGFTKNKSCNLMWFFMKEINPKIIMIWILFLLMPALTMVPKYQGLILFVFGFATLGMASIVNNAAIGSLWCWFAIGLILYKIVAPN